MNLTRRYTVKNSIIATVGISILTNFERLQRENSDYADKHPEEMFELLKDDPDVNLGAEITGINNMIARHIVDQPKNLYLITSGSERDKIASGLVKSYFEDVFTGEVETVRITELNPDKPEEFRDLGLRHLVKAMMSIIAKNNKNKSEFVINATGGYKAQVSFAGLVGQVLDIPVYYLFESFNEVIRLPHMPIALDRELWVNNQEFFNRIKTDGALKESVLDEDVKQTLLEKDIIYISDENIHLSSVGLILDEFLLEQAAEDKVAYFKAMEKARGFVNKRINDYRESFPSHTPLSLFTLLESLERLSYVEKIEFDSVEKNYLSSISFSPNDEKLGEIQATYYDGRDNWRFTIVTEAEDNYDVQENLIDLNLRYTNPFEKPTPKEVEFILIRHGQHEGEAENRIEGWADFELTEFGKEQAAAAAKALTAYEIDHLYTSSLARAKQTAEIIGEEIDLKPIDLHDTKAMNYGLSGGLTKFEAEVLYPKPRHYKTPHYKSWGSESELEFTRRVLSSFYELYYQNPGKKIALVTHGRVISVIIREIMDLPITQDLRIESEDTSIHRFKFGPDKSEILKLNDTNHLSGLMEGDL